MHLLHCHRGSEDNIIVSLEEYNEADAPPYAILSHRWGCAGEEASFQDLMNGTAESKKGYAKVQGCCAQALEDDLSHVWIDTCCIDKSSSAELSEAINSMFRYYKNADVCYAYLQDVTTAEREPYAWNAGFQKSDLFKRGWTLQELIAPKTVVFFSKDWIEIGTRRTLAKTLERITNIDREILWHPARMKDANIATRMSWAAARNTTRVEDRAYSLMGIFDVNMPIIYGEGEGAFLRLQLEIIRKSTDHSIFAWDDQPQNSYIALCSGILARDPKLFSNGSKIETLNLRTVSEENVDNKEHYELTNLGLRIWLPVQPLRIGMYDVLRADLACRACVSNFDDCDDPFTIYLVPVSTAANSKQYRRLIVHNDVRGAFEDQRDYHGVLDVLSVQLRQVRPELNPIKFRELFIDTSFLSERHHSNSDLLLEINTLRKTNRVWTVQINHSDFKNLIVVDTDHGPEKRPPRMDPKASVRRYTTTVPSFGIRLRNVSTDEELVAVIYFDGISSSCNLKVHVGPLIWETDNDEFHASHASDHSIQRGFREWVEHRSDWIRCYLPLTKRDVILSVRYVPSLDDQQVVKAKISLQDSSSSSAY